MASPRPRPRRFLLPLVLGAVLAGEITGIALARTLPPTIVPVAASTPDPADSARPEIVDRTGGSDDARNTVGLIADPVRTQPATTAPNTPPAQAPQSPIKHVAVATPAAKVKTTSSGTSYRGTNHVWIPSLGINKGVQSFPCSRKRPPDAGVYRWGCAGRNNVYLLSHAWSTFMPLHDAYYNGRLKKGLKVVYADGGGRVHTYSVVWWKVVAPTTAASWAWASLSKPSMTLQTCVGANSQYRLMVRLVRIR